MEMAWSDRIPFPSLLGLIPATVKQWPRRGRINFGVGPIRLGRNQRGRSVSVLTMTLSGLVQRRRGRDMVRSTHRQRGDLGAAVWFVQLQKLV